MKKYFYLFVAMMATVLVACEPKNTPDPKPDPDPIEEDETPEYLDASKESSMVVFLGPIALTGDTSIVVTDAEVDELSGEVQMGIRGSIACETGFRVAVTRSEEGGKDELCGVGQCVPGDGTKLQNFDFSMMGQKSGEWYTHFTPAKEGDHKITYKFMNYNRTITLAVTYSYKILYE